MGAGGRYALIYDPALERHFSRIPRKHHSMIRREIEGRLQFEPETEAKNRKPLRRPSVLGEAWKLRFGPDNRFRVFYRTDRKARVVRVLGIGAKVGSRLLIGGEEFEL